MRAYFGFSCCAVIVLFCFFLPSFNCEATQLISISSCEHILEPGTKPVGIKDKFAPNSPTINIVAAFDDLNIGTQIKGVWIADDNISTPNYIINTTEFKIKEEGKTSIHFSLSKPKSGWPIGNYRFKLYFNNEFLTKISFSVIEKPEPQASDSFGTGLQEKDTASNWTVFLYMDGDNNLEPFALKDMDEMEMIFPDRGLEVIVLLDRAEDFTMQQGNWKDSKLFRVVNDGQAGLKSKILDLPGEVNMGDPAVLQKYLTYAIKSFPADKYALILWNHGGGGSAM